MLSIMQILKRCFGFLFALFLTIQLFTACKPSGKHSIDVSDQKVVLKFNRFEQDLFHHTTIDTTVIQSMRSKYGKFFDLYCRRMIQLPAPDDAILAINLNQYVHDKYIIEVNSIVQKKYKDVNNLQADLEEVFKHYKHYFPQKNIPNIVTYTAPFNYNVMTMESVLGIGLDMYIGSDYKYYSTLELPQYMIRKFREEYIVNDCIKGWFQSEWDVPSNANNMLSNMIYQGKLLYFSQALAPEMNDTIRIGFTANQLQWCIDNESKVWSFLIEQKLLYNKMPGIYMKFINDGNSTNGFPKEAPAKLGCFIGWQIVQSYMDANKNTTLEQLLKNNDEQKILSESKYKPRK